MNCLARVIWALSWTFPVMGGCSGDSFGTAGAPADSGSTDTGNADAGSDATADTGGDTGGDTGADGPGDGATSDVVSIGLSLWPTMHTFPPTEVGGRSESFPFEVTNTGTAEIGDIVADIQGEGMVIESLDCYTLQPNASCSIGVYFAPLAVAPVNGSLTVSSSLGGMATAELFGDALVIVDQGIAVEPAVHDFGAFVPGQTAEHEFRVRNTGGTMLQKISANVMTSVGSAPVFSIRSNGCGYGPLPPGADCPITVQFAPLPSEPGLKSEELRVHADAISGTAFLTGHTADVFVRPNGDDKKDGLSPASAFRTITRALNFAGEGWTVHLLPGTYGAAEKFPLVLNNERVQGEGDPKIGVPTIALPLGIWPPTVFELQGNYPDLAHVRLVVPDSNNGGVQTALLMRPRNVGTVDDVQLELGAGWIGLRTDVSSQTAITANSLNIQCASSASTVMTPAIEVGGFAQFTLESSTIRECKTGLTIDGSARTVVRNTQFLNTREDAIRVKSGQAIVDLGTWDTNGTMARGENKFVGFAKTFVALRVMAALTVNASGNYWLPGVQGADASGQYGASELKVGPLMPTAGPNNFFLTNSARVQL